MQSTVVDSRYSLLDRLGDGGMGEVYLAHDALLGRDVALKVLREPHAASAEFVERFRREARHAAALSHPNIVQVYDAGEATDGVPYMAMEYLPGGTLRDRMTKLVRMAPRTAAAVTLQIAGALSVAHERGVVHRDIKPENVLVTENGDVKVADFGIARASDATVMTRTDLVLGTVRYISPEQAMAEPVGPAGDLYSLGVVLYEMLSGEVPFEAEGPIAVAMKHLKESPAPLRELNPAIPGGLAAITAKLMQKDPADRYRSAGELAEDLERFLAGDRPLSTAETARIAPVARKRRLARRRRSFVVALVVFLLVALLVPIVAGLAWSVGERPSIASVFAPEDREPLRRMLPPSTLAREDLESPATSGDTRQRTGSAGSEKDSQGSEAPAAPPPERQASVQQASVVRPEVQAPETVVVPDLVGMTVAEAEATLADAGLILRVASYARSQSMPEGKILSQDAPSGYETSPGATVAVVVSSGPPPAPQPEPEPVSEPENGGPPELRVPEVEAPEEVKVPEVEPARRAHREAEGLLTIELEADRAPAVPEVGAGRGQDRAGGKK